MQYAGYSSQISGKIEIFQTYLRKTQLLNFMKIRPARAELFHAEGQTWIQTDMTKLIQINHQPDATIFQFIILTFIYSSTCFGRFPAHHQELNDCSGSLWF